MTVWLLTVWLVYGEVNQIWLQQQYTTESECLQWQRFYNEYPFRAQCTTNKTKS